MGLLWAKDTAHGKAQSLLLIQREQGVHEAIEPGRAQAFGDSVHVRLGDTGDVRDEQLGEREAGAYILLGKLGEVADGG